MNATHRRSLAPRGLFNRAILILLGPVILLQLVVGYVFFERHYQRVTHQMTHGVALELGYVVNQVEAATSPEAIARQLEEIEHPLGFELALLPDAAPRAGVERERLDFTGRALVETLEAAFDRPLFIDLVSLHRSVRIEIGTDAGVLRADVPRNRMTVQNPHQLLVLMVLAALLLTTVAVLFLRNQIRPIRHLAEAAEAFGKGRSLPFRPAGAEEIRRAGAAFLSMRARIERQMEQRTQMLSGVSHDLRTPLTRMKLTLEMMEENEDVEAMRADVSEMEAMLSEFLAFARGESTEAVEETDPVELAGAVADGARRAGADLALAVRDDSRAEAGSPPTVALRPGAVGRALQNLVGNAARYGKRARLTVRLLPKTLDFIVEDDGPGIPADERARALQPFARLDRARNLDRGGSVGLGLTIALDVARAHGGTLELGDSAELGGLRATLRLPR
jgi:two-component system, OmpR family, osmolarity sensor histidine kinase EnvZ